jgi:type I restriction enzyme, S subunit
MPEWRRCSVGDLCDAGMIELQTGPFGSQLHAHDYLEEGIPVVPTEALRNRQIDRSVLPRISTAKAEDLRRHRLRPGDILFARRGAQAAGHIGYVRAPEDGFICGTGAIRLRVKEGNEEIAPDFLSHVFANPESVRWFKSHAIGATMPNLNEGIIRSFQLCVPPPAEQHTIAHILGTLDDKIELNRRMSETLESMAQAIFRSWFVDFRPVRARADDHGPALREKIAEAFPDRFEDSVLGDIPAGWRASRLGDEVRTVLGGTPPRTEPSYWGGQIPWINSGKANEFRVVEPSEFITREGLSSSATTLLPSRTTVIAITGATLGQISLTEIETCANQSIIGVIGTATIPSEFLYFWVKEKVEDLLAWQTGGAQQHINKNNVNDLPMLCPSDLVMAAYVALVRPWFDRIKTCCHESRTLAALRDALLPKLISGDLRVKEAEDVLGGPTSNAALIEAP